MVVETSPPAGAWVPELAEEEEVVAGVAAEVEEEDAVELLTALDDDEEEEELESPELVELDEELELVVLELLSPTMWKGNEYWKTVSSESSWSLRP